MENISTINLKNCLAPNSFQADKVFSPERISCHVDFKKGKGFIMVIYFIFFLFAFFNLAGQTPTQAVLIKNGDFGSINPYLENLFFGLNTTINLEDNKIKIFGVGNPKVVVSDAPSAFLLYEAHPAFANIELVNVKINTKKDLDLVLYAERLSHFKNLQFLSIIFGFDVCGEENTACINAILEKMITGDNSALKISFRLAVPK